MQMTFQTNPFTGLTTDATSNLTSTNAVLALMACRQDCQH